jgi:hypothetical protein
MDYRHLGQKSEILEKTQKVHKTRFFVILGVSHGSPRFSTVLILDQKSTKSQNVIFLANGGNP